MSGPLHRSTVLRRKMKEDDPEKYDDYLKRRRESDRKRRELKRKQWEEEGPHTRLQLEEREHELQVKRDKEKARYWKKKAETVRQTRNSSTKTPEPTPHKIRPCDMSPTSYRQYRSAQRKRQRENMSSQKKTAVKMKRRLEYQRQREAIARTLEPEAGPSQPEPTRLRQALYNLNHSYKKKAKQLGATNEEFARSALNLINARTPEKRAAIRDQQKTHPCRHLFQIEDDGSACDVESELGFDTVDVLEHGPEQEEIISNTLHEQVKMYYCQDDVSRMLPHSRYSTKHGPARIMLTTVKDAHASFLAENSDRKIGRTLFQSLRPRNVRLMGSVPIESCLCIYCTNVRLKINAINLLLGSSGNIPPEKDMLYFLTCKSDDRWPHIDCIDGKCDKCSDRMRSFNLFCWDISRTQAIRWQHWARNQDAKMEPLPKEGTLKDLLDELKSDIEEPTKGTSFVQHLFTAYWQYSQFKESKRDPEEGEVVMVQDFGENRKAAYAEEIKSAHFGKRQITVHPVVSFYRSGESVIRHSLIFLSDDITHDHQAVQEFTHRTIAILRERLTLKKLTIWSDGAASQYKGRGSFHDLTLLPHNPQRLYYGSEHGKGESDGETGLMSQALKRATYAGKNFPSAKEMAEYLNENHGSDKRQYILVPCIDRTELDGDVQTIPGTRRYHQFQSMGQYVLRARRLACFCSACRAGRISKCMNSEMVGDYTVHKCKPSVKTVLNEAFVEEPENDDATSNQTLPDNPYPKEGDFLKLVCRVHKSQKTYYAMVVEANGPPSFSVLFLQRSGTKYCYGPEYDPSEPEKSLEKSDVGLIKEGPPDHYTWTILDKSQWSLDHRQLFSFSI